MVQPVGSMSRVLLATITMLALFTTPVRAQVLASPSDPLLALRDQTSSGDLFRTLIAATVRRHPTVAESTANVDEARSGVDAAHDLRTPRVDLSLTSYRVLSRAFSNDPLNIIERSRPRNRTDALVSVQETLFDFNATPRRIKAAGARLRGADAALEANADRVALAAISAWYDVFGYRALTGLTRSFIADQQAVRSGVLQRVKAGVTAEADVANVDSNIARAQTRLAGYERGLANAEARFHELTGAPAPAQLSRAVLPAMGLRDGAEAAAISAKSPIVRSAQAQADAVEMDARAVKADRAPLLTAGIDAGRYGAFENGGDYDIRGTVTVRQRLFGQIDANYKQALARGRAARARADRVTEEASRDASIAWADVVALETQQTALEAAYLASKRAREAVLERFGASRGSLFDVLSAQEGFFDSASAYIQGLIDLDTARYALLSRTGRLLPTLGIDPRSARGGE
ncbi:TolC family protein [Sphingomonas sp. HMWF008]|nr:TolC family protein [Sphingomonas sp. HMWF008]